MNKSDKRKICKKCILPENYMNTTINDDGICNYCVDAQTVTRISPEKREKAHKEFEATVNKPKRRGKYDCIVAFSGGKDSTYLLYLLTTKYKLNALAVTIDTGFFNRVAHKNIYKTTKKLNVDHVFLKPREDIFIKLYSHILTNIDPLTTSRHDICMECFKIKSNLLINLAIEKDISDIFIGWSPHEPDHFINDFFYRYSDEMSDENLRDFFSIPHALRNVLTEEEKSCFADIDSLNIREIPQLLAPFHILEYDSQDIMKKLVQLDLISRNRVHSNVTNCYLTRLMIYLDIKTLGYHTWVHNYCCKIRDGKSSRLKIFLYMKIVELKVRLNIFKRDSLKFCLKKLNLPMDDLLKGNSKARNKNDNI